MPCGAAPSSASSEPERDRTVPSVLRGRDADGERAVSGYCLVARLWRAVLLLGRHIVTQRGTGRMDQAVRWLGYPFLPPHKPPAYTRTLYARCSIQAVWEGQSLKLASAERH